jgi:hypothetical protein
MCSACSGDYQGDGDGWGTPPANSGDKVGGDPLEQEKSVRPGASRMRTRGHERTQTGNQGPPCECEAGCEYEVLVSADEIIVIHRITGDFAGFP